MQIEASTKAHQIKKWLHCYWNCRSEEPKEKKEMHTYRVLNSGKDRERALKICVNLILVYLSSSPYIFLL